MLNALLMSHLEARLHESASHFAIEQDIIAVKRGEPGANVLCTYAWAKPDAEEIEKRNEDIYMEGVMSRKRLEALKLYEPTENELNITFNQSGFKTTAEAVKGLDAMVERMDRTDPEEIARKIAAAVR